MTQTNLRAIAIDDEPMGLSIIETFCQRMGNITVKTFTQAGAGLAAMRIEHPDLLFLDIDLGPANGVELARSVPRTTSIVFTTAHNEYALDGFNLDAADYLLKPFSYARFQEAIGKVLRRMPREEQTSITVKADYKNQVVTLADIVYLEAMDNYVRLYLADGRIITTQSTLSALVVQLPDEKFLRVHKSFVVACNYVERYTRQLVYLRNVAHPIPIGRTFASAFSKL